MSNAKLLTEDEVIEILKAKLTTSSQKELAEDIGVSQQYLCDVLKIRRPPAGKILEYLHLRDLGKRYGK